MQEARKSSGFDVSDRISLVWRAEDSELGRATAEAIRAHAGFIAEEVLATTMSEGTRGSDSAVPGSAGRVFTIDDLGVSFTVTRRG